MENNIFRNSRHKKEMNDLNSTLRMATFGGFGFMATLLIAFLTGVVTI
jgi:hypothetical protein